MQTAGGRPTRPCWGGRVALQSKVNAARLIDLEAVEFVEPTMALRIAAVIAQHEAAKQPLEITPPTAVLARRHLARVGLAAAMGLEEGAAADILLPVSALRGDGQVDRLGEELERVLRERLPKRFAAGAPDLKRAFSELCDNACTHGRSEHGGFVLVQRYDRDRVVVAVGDLGVGIPGHLGRALPDLGELDEGRRIARALRPGISAREEKGGDGLARIVDAVRGSQFADSELRIWSGAGRVRVRQRAEPNAWLVESPTPGTWAEFELSVRG